MLKNIESQIEKTIIELEQKARSGDSEAQYDLFVFLNAKAMENYDLECFQRAEKFLILSANRGHKEAKELLEKQDIRKYIFHRRVERKKDET